MNLQEFKEQIKINKGIKAEGKDILEPQKAIDIFMDNMYALTLHQSSFQKTIKKISKDLKVAYDHPRATDFVCCFYDELDKQLGRTKLYEIPRKRFGQTISKVLQRLISVLEKGNLVVVGDFYLFSPGEKYLLDETNIADDDLLDIENL